MVNLTKNSSLFSLAILRLLSSTSNSSFSTLCRKFPSFNLPDTQTPPVAKKVPFKFSVHGRELQDPYHWMSNIHDPEFIDYVNLENLYAEGFMADTMRLQEKLFREMTQRMPVKTETPPNHWGQWLYSQFIPEGKEYPILCRRSKARKSGWVKWVFEFLSGGAKENVLLDWNELAEKYGYVHVGTCRVSPDQNYLAYTLDSKGDERFVLFIKDLRDGSILSTSGVDGVVSLAWMQDVDNLYLYYTLSDASQRPYRVLRTKIGSDVNGVCFQDVYTEIDTNFCVDVANTKDGKFLTVNSNSRTSSEVYVIDASKPKDGLRRVHKRISNVQYFLEHHNGYFYVLTNTPIHENIPCENYYLGICKVEDSGSATWQNILLPSEGTSIHDMDITNGHLVLFLRKNEIAQTCSVSIPINLSTKQHQLTLDSVDPWYFPMPSNMCTVVPGSNNDFMSSVYRLVLSSPVMPDVIVDYDMTSKEFHIVQQDEVMEIAKNSGTSASDIHTPLWGNKISKEITGQNISDHQWRNFSSSYACETRDVPSHDGVQVPLTILYSKVAWNKGCSPGLLYGYGAYGEDLDKSWCSDRLSLLDRGWVLAFADVRGGGGDDSAWHKSGSGLQKLNSIHDFISCAEYLINEKFVHCKKLSAVGHSAGGLLVASAINNRPELFGAAILKVPFLDICNTLLDSSLPLTILDYEEFGNPQIKSEFESILSYSPYENLPKDICYPPTLLLASFHDSRVGVWEAAKWVAKVRDITCSQCSPSVILKTNMFGGHFGEGGRFAHCRETAYEYAFLLKALGASGEI